MNWLKKSFQHTKVAQPDPARDPYLYQLWAVLHDQRFFNYNKQMFYDNWLRSLPENMRNNPELLQRAHDLLRADFGFEPTGDLVNSNLPPQLLMHLEMYFEIMMRQMPELRGPEFDIGDDFVQHEGKREIYSKWLEELSPEIKGDDGDLKPEYKQEVGQFLKHKFGFDPYEFAEDSAESGEDNTDAILSAEELQRLFEEEPYIEPAPVEDLEEMFGGDTYDPGPAESRNRPNQDRPDQEREWWQE